MPPCVPPVRSIDSLPSLRQPGWRRRSSALEAATAGCPPAQGKRWYYALRGRNVNVTALRYEKEEHGLQSQPETRLHWITSVVDYFRRHHADSPAP